MRNTDVLAKPSALDVLVDTIPLPMRELPQWVVWSWAWSKRRGQWDKPPKRPDGRAASSTDPATWSTFDEVLAVYEQHKVDGIGFVLTEESGIVGIDIDNCLHEGKFDPVVVEVMQKLKTYAEVSPSNTGIRAFALGKLPGGGRKRGNVEVYAEGRYLTVTGHQLGSTRTIEARDTEVEKLWESLAASPRQPRVAVLAQPAVSLNDSELLAKARLSKHGNEFWDLYTGGLGGKPSNSEADMALCCHLAFWTNRDAARVDHLFRTSLLMRDKWDERHGELTYGEITVQKAIEFTPDGYTGPRAAAVVTTETATPEAPGGRIVVHTFGELLHLPAADVNWICERFLAEGAITELTAWVKTGKSTLMAQVIAAVLHGTPFLGVYEVDKSSVLLMTEERSASLREALEEGGVLPSDPLHIMMWNEQRGIPWPEQVAQAAAKARELGCKTIIIDTLGTWAGVEDENDAAAAGRAMSPIQQAAVDLGIVIIRQARKSGGEVQTAGRGSSAYAGAVDILMTLAHLRDDKGHLLETDTRRRLSVVSRFERDQIEPLLLDYRDRRYEALESTQVDMAATDKVLKDVRSHGPSRPIDVSQRTGLKPGTARQALLRLTRRGRLEVDESTVEGQVLKLYRLAVQQKSQDQDEYRGVTEGVTPAPIQNTPRNAGVTAGVTLTQTIKNTPSDGALQPALHEYKRPGADPRRGADPPVVAGTVTPRPGVSAVPDLLPHEICHRHGGPYWERQASNGGGWVCSRCQGDDPRELKRQWVRA